MSLFLIEVIESVYKEKTEEYEKLCAVVDQKIKEVEPGMLIHIQTKISENNHESVYKWIEVLASAEDLQTHIDNECVQSHMKKLENGILSAPPRITVYCDWPEEQKHSFSSHEEIDIDFAPLVNGYLRNFDCHR